MPVDRRSFLKLAAAGAGCAACGQAAATTAPAPTDGVGMLMDITECIGCRKCEFACAQENKLSDAPVTAFEDSSVYERQRRMTDTEYTVVNRHPGKAGSSQPLYVKSQCMHCLRPACASACIVGALQREPNGVVSYDAWKCIGCRYCMVACPFQVPAYEYANPWTPEVRKCVFCAGRIKDGKAPACAEMCPPQALLFGKREDLLELARTKIVEHPGRYVNRIYGEHDAGGTSWVYLAPKSFEELGFLEVGDAPIPNVTETLQHSVFRYGVPPLLVFGLLAAASRTFRPEAQSDAADARPDHEGNSKA